VATVSASEVVLRLNSITCAGVASLRTASGSCAAARPHSNARLLRSTETPFSSIARSSDSWRSGIQPICEA